jgi:glycine oxidase
VSKPDVLVVGAGVVGCAIAYRLARRGLSVVVLERSVPGSEASSAAAGMLAAQMESHEAGSSLSLAIASRDRFAQWSEDLRADTGIDVEYRRCGILNVAFTEEQAETAKNHAATQSARGLSAEPVSASELRALEPAISEQAISAIRFEQDARVDPPKLLRALRIAAEHHGAQFLTGSVVRRLVVHEDRAEAIELEGGRKLSGGNIVIAAGPWSNLIPGVPLGPEDVRPARGQIVELLGPRPLIKRCVWGPGVYLSPRDDGRLLLGSTTEFVGFERLVTAGAVHDLLAAALALVPKLRELELTRSWAAFRPFTKDGRPRIGKSSVEGLLLATGHFRNGILLSPITAEMIESIVTNTPLPAGTAEP